MSPSRRVIARAGKSLLVFVVCALGSLFAGYALHNRLAVLERKIDAVGQTTGGSIDDFLPLAAKLEQILESQRQLETAMARLEAAAKSVPQLQPRPNLSESDFDLLRSFFKLVRTPGVAPRFRLGDYVPGSELKGMPEFVAEKISAELRGTRFLFDRNGSLVITAGPNNEVIVIVSA